MFKLFQRVGWVLAVAAAVAFGVYLTKLKPDGRRPPGDFAPASAPAH